MTKTEYLALLASELKKNKVLDAADILGEYEQHFDFKMSDGFSEEEIAAKLGAPAQLASQFESGGEAARGGVAKVITLIGLCFADVFTAMFFILLFAWEFIMAACAIAFSAVAFCLIGGIQVYGIIPSMPYWCGAVFALASLALAVLFAAGGLYFTALIRQLMRAYGRFHHNALAAASGNAVLPSLPINPRLTAKRNRQLRTVCLLSLIIFAVSFILGNIAAMLSAGALEYWHSWSWFVQ